MTTTTTTKKKNKKNFEWKVMIYCKKTHHSTKVNQVYKIFPEVKKTAMYTMYKEQIK